MALHAIFAEAPRAFADDFTYRIRPGMVANGFFIDLKVWFL